jgi:hypothetical protein
MSDPVAELAGYFRNQTPLTAAEVERFAAQARGSGMRWADIALACDRGGPGGGEAQAGAWRVFRDIQHAAGIAAGDGQLLAPLAWPCEGCGRLVSDVAPLGRPVHIEAGHTRGCARLARDQADDDRERRARIPSLIAGSEPADGALQRRRLARRFTDWCPRCGWHGYFDKWAATINGDWARLICDDCRADLDPAVTVTVVYHACSARAGGLGLKGPFGVIRQRIRSDLEFPDLGQILTWEPFWQWTPILAQQARGEADCEITQVSRGTADEIIRSLIRRRWPDEALGLPWVDGAYPVPGT